MRVSRMTAFLAAAVLAVSALGAQSLKGMSLNGSTGLYSIPSGRIGWERTSDFGLDLGYHAIIRNRASHIPKLSVSLFKWVELSGAVDIQPGDHQSDLIAGAKIQFPLTNTAIALGGNFQSLNVGNEYYSLNAGQVYLAVTYAGQFFNMPAETTVVLGKTFIKDNIDSNIDFGMGFDLVLLPKVFEKALHWVTDFANFSYSADPFGADFRSRGVLNTGLRVDLSIIPVLSKFKFVVDVLMADAFDDGRSFSVGTVFCIPIL
ncbi:MAG: hypothetical protein LBC62_03295 [Treponema sp.]|nr:hypothetical protein [Treponema sp.]